MSRRTSNWLVLLLVGGLLTAIFVLGGKPRIEDGSLTFKDDVAAAGQTQYKMGCKLPKGIGDGFAGKVGISPSYRNSKSDAREDAYTAAMGKRGWTAVENSYPAHTYDLIKKGRVVYTIYENCWVYKKRTATR